MFSNFAGEQPPPSSASSCDPQSIGNEAASMIAADVFGQTAHLDGIASKININSAIAELHGAIAAFPATEKVALVQVQRLQPQLLNDEHMLEFLWAENFSAPEAAKRMARYWNERYKLFGPDKYLLPMTLKGALKDDSLALSRGYVQLLPETDTAGRAILYIDWSSHEPSVGYSEESMHRVLWYMVHVAKEDINVLQRGIVMLIYPQEARLDQFDHSLWTKISDSCRQALPIQWRSTHIVHPNRFFSIIHPVFMSSLPKDIQDRVVVHSGTKMKVLANLLRYCLPWDRIPSEIGGCVDLDFEKWLSQRMLKEDGMPPAASMPPSITGGDMLAAGNSSSNGAMGMLGGQMMMQPDEATSAKSNPYLLNLPGQGSSATIHGKPAAKVDPKPGVAKGPKIIVKSGRKSDPRMDKAVQAKLDDSSLSLLDALRVGGFVFPALDESATPQYTVVDSDNVKITQRKNQLLRRIRTAKKKAGG